ncbi:MAG: hypothetical protein FJ291_05125 [Planctomycetes bacterium]|nr:hypothetical protein [Planctomycetota bacterium]
MGKSRRVTLGQLLIAVGAIALALSLLFYLLPYQVREARRLRCRNNLNQLAKGMDVYTIDQWFPWPAGRAACGTGKRPNFGGAEWLASLYWTRYVTDPEPFICPGSSDNNSKGADLGSYGSPDAQPLRPGAVSYAGMHDKSVGIYLTSKLGKAATYATSRMAIKSDFPPEEPMACDDTEEPINHGSRDNGGMNVLFFDSHVEWWTHERVDLERGVGAGELVHLRN